MKKSIRDIKACARDALLGHYGTAIAALILAEVISLIIQTPFSRMSEQGMMFMNYSRIGIGAIGGIIASLVVVLLQAGVTQVHLRIARGEHTSFRDIFYTFKNRPDRYLGYGLLTIVVSFLCILPGMICLFLSLGRMALTPETRMALLSPAVSFEQIEELADAMADPMAITLTLVGSVLMIIGSIILIIIMLSWSMVVYLMLDNTDLRVKEAIRQSRNMMKGHKWKLFLLGVSFIGFFLLSILSLGLALLWIIPYLTQSVTQFYLSFFQKEETIQEPYMEV